MLKISEAVEAIVESDAVLRPALARRLLNLSQVSRHIHAAVEARTMKPVRPSAIAMALSRLQARLPDLDAGPPLRLADRVTVQRGLSVLTFPNTRRCQESLLGLQERIRKEHGFLTITEGVREITLIVDSALRVLVDEIVPERPTRAVPGAAGLSVTLTEENLATPGVLYRLLQPLALQGINVQEVASTTREFHVYLEDADVMLALESLYRAFGR